MRTNRKEFYRTGSLIAFPSLPYLATFGNVAEKTAQRAIEDLEKAGLLQTKQRNQNSSLYFLTIPPDAETNFLGRDAQAIASASFP